MTWGIELSKDLLFLGCSVLLILVNVSCPERSPMLSAIILNGNRSYLTYPAWTPCVNASISLEFKIHKPSGLLLYAENNTTRTFAAVRLVGNGKLRVELNLFYGRAILENDSPDYISKSITFTKDISQWHSLSLFVGRTYLKITLDSYIERIMFPIIPGTHRITRRLGDGVYIGGLRPKLRADATKRSQFAAAIEPSFGGEIRNYRVTRCPNGQWIRPHPMEVFGLSNGNNTDWCSVVRRKCQNGGTCVNAESGPLCDCSLTGFEGKLCDQAASNQIATFDGSGYVTYSISSGPISSTKDETRFEFKTIHNSTFLFYTGYQLRQSADSFFVVIFLENSALEIRIHHGGPKQYSRRVLCQNNKSTCADNRWHKISVARTADTHLTAAEGSLLIGITVDGSRLPDEKIKSINRHLTSRTMFLGGQPPKSGVPYVSHLPNLKGCIRQAFYKADNIMLKILELARKNSHHISAVGGVDFGNCTDDSTLETVTFTTPESYLIAPGWSVVSSGSIKFAFRTTEPNGLLLYQQADRRTKDYSDFLAFELREGGLYFLINTGAGTFRTYVQETNLADGRRHHVALTFNPNGIKIRLDGRVRKEIPENSYQYLNLNGALYLGGVPELDRAILPHELWSAVLSQGFVGCLGDVKLDGKPVNLISLSRLNHTKGVTPGCTGKNFLNQCANRPCHTGECIKGWGRFICDCTRTNFTGITCSKTAPIVQFNGFQYMRVKMSKGYQTESEDVGLRFRTNRPNGLLFMTRSPSLVAEDRIEVNILEGRILLLLNFGKNTKRFETETTVSDNNWHNLLIRRRERKLTVTVDRNSFSFDLKFSEEIKLVISDLLLAGSPNTTEIRGPSKLLSHESMNIGNIKEKLGLEKNFFIGHMMHFTFNGVNYFDLANTISPTNIETTASLSNAQHIKQFPLSFSAPSSYMLLPKISIFGDFRLEFWLRSWVNNGLVLLLDGTSGDYLVLELIDGQLHLVFNWGSGSQRRVSQVGRVSDSRWHRVQLVRSLSRSRALAFRVDGYPSGREAYVPVNDGGINFNQMGDLYLGGTEPNYRHQMKFQSVNGFHGCIASFYLNKTEYGVAVGSSGKGGDLLPPLDGQLTNPFEIKVRSKNVTPGCPRPELQCSQEICHYRGRCVQQWRRLRCDCSRTTFVGDTCDIIGTTLKFGDAPGHIVFEFYPTQNTTRDELALGVQTLHKQSVVLIHIYGEGRSPDYIKMYIVMDKGRGVVQVRYNMGSGTHVIAEPAVDVSDGGYHVIRFTREGPNGFLQINNLPQRELRPPGHQSNHFNQQRKIYLGQSAWFLTRVKRFAETFENPYNGYITGLVYNDFPLNDIVNGVMIAGIQVYNKTLVWIEPNFRPKLDGYPPPKKSLPVIDSTESETDSMQSTTSSKGAGSGRSKDRDGLVVPKPGCPDPFSSTNTDCRPVDPGGIVRPNVQPITLPNNIPVVTDRPNEVNTDPQIHLVTSPVNFPLNPQSIRPPVIGGVVPAQPADSSEQPIRINLWLIIAISCGGVTVLLLLVCIIYRCRRKDEGSYSVEENHSFMESAAVPFHENPSSFTNGSAKSGGTNKSGAKSKRKRGQKSTRKESKEWYV